MLVALASTSQCDCGGNSGASSCCMYWGYVIPASMQFGRELCCVCVCLSNVFWRELLLELLGGNRVRQSGNFVTTTRDELQCSRYTTFVKIFVW